MNDYTSNLPLLNDTNQTSLIGHNTSNSIISGVLNGMNAEIIGMIHRYNEKFGSIDIYLTEEMLDILISLKKITSLQSKI